MHGSFGSPRTALTALLTLALVRGAAVADAPKGAPSPARGEPRTGQPVAVDDPAKALPAPPRSEAPKAGARADAGTPESAPEPSATPREGEALAKLERELAEVMDGLVSARARAEVLARGLFRTQLVVEVVRRADALRLGKLTLRLDGVPIHESAGEALARGEAELFRGHVAPGMHELTIEISERAKDGPAFGYTRSERYRIDVKKERRTRVELVLRDDSDMAEQAAEGDDGAYDVRTELRVHRERARE